VENTGPKPFVFVLMPFNADFKDVYELGIKPACVDAGTHPERVDEQIFQGSIVSRIYNNIAKADIIVADMSGRNPNVFYEVGYAHALNKLVILVTKDGSDIPFDLKDYPHIIYKNISGLKSELTTRVQWFVNNPMKGAELAQTNIELYINGVPLKDRPKIQYRINRGGGVTGLDIHNPTSLTFRTDSIQIGLITEEPFFGKTEYFPKSLRLPDKRILSLFPKVDTLLPGGWETLDFAVELPDDFQVDAKHEWVFRVFTPVTFIDFPFLFEVAFS
jgi:hypothetical protein